MLAGCIPAVGGSSALYSSIPSGNTIIHELPEDGEYHSPETSAALHTLPSWLLQRQLRSRRRQIFIAGNSEMGKMPFACGKWAPHPRCVFVIAAEPALSAAQGVGILRYRFVLNLYSTPTEIPKFQLSCGLEVAGTTG